VWITYGGVNQSSLLSPFCNSSSHDGLLTIQADPRLALAEDTLTSNTSEVRQLEEVREKVRILASDGLVFVAFTCGNNEHVLKNSALFEG